MHIQLRILCLLVAQVVLVATSHAQSHGIGRIDDSQQQLFQRLYVAGHLPGAHLSSFPLSGGEMSALVDSLEHETLDNMNSVHVGMLTGESPLPLVQKVRSYWGAIYRNGRDFATYSGDGFSVTLNPVAYLRGGSISGLPDSSGTTTYWRNTRGLEVAGEIGKYIFFDTRLEENQRRDPRLTPEPSNKSATRLGKATVNENGVLDYMIATGSAGFRSRFFEVRLGRENARQGWGINSLSLSNYGPPFEQLQIRTTFGRVQYVNTFASLATERRFNRDSIVPKKYAAMHRLEVNVTDRIQIAAYESIIFATDSLEGRKGFDLAYLNPIVFYRAVEADRGSPDNVLLGAAFAYRPVDGVLLYSELLLDELRVSRIGEKWWANKWAGQIGIQAVPVQGLHAGIEYTRLRPYLYGHNEPLNAYVHYNDFLGHPAGPNSVDVTGFVNYHITPLIEIRALASRTVRGRNDGEINYGSDPLISNNSRVGDEDISILQGIKQTELNLDIAITYQLLPDLYLEAGFWTRRIADDEFGDSNLSAPLIGFRWGIPMETARN